MPYPVVDRELCDGCEECVAVCPVEVFEIVDGKSQAVNPEDCIDCQVCLSVCIPQAITLHEFEPA